ncbi:heterokaryon incompatibility [Stemphylium lycopersici]|uniref:HET-domain-containing protein n=1 Tax=Stemphylium lycopersici TaxID=183478 RepID=A0A364MY41_STELY|nr:heterokaryon incompatibility [Stemphylium lycopersici]RAR06261.1 HET-domain-containing protein [Stemphylium lycopersici]
MSLCPDCGRVTLPNLLTQLEDVPPWWMYTFGNSTPRGMVHCNDARKLADSAAAGCPLCCLIIDALSPEALSYASSVEAHDNIEIFRHMLSALPGDVSNCPIYLRPNHDPNKPGGFPESGVTDAHHVRGLKIVVPFETGPLGGSIRLFAAPDSPAGMSCHVIGRPPLSSSGSTEAFSLIDRWLNCCLTQHKACQQTLAGFLVDESTPPILPTRVVYVGDSEQTVSPRLLETRGSRGHYIALSYCWGTSTIRPLTTTRSNLAEHSIGISWESIPRLHQDAITITRRLGFHYLWIDSVCIIQDSRADWLIESNLMANVYQHARLTIATSHNTDCSQTCFFPRPPAPPVVEIPYVPRSGEVHGSMFATLTLADYPAISPDHGALANRAWATQEWLLSRRMVFYTAGSVVWSCKVISQRETGASFHATARNPRWKNIVEKYSARLLTHHTDRLIALEGLRAALGAKRAIDTYCFGLWKNSMPDQLLWYCLQPAERPKSELDLPTWTWASSLHGVRFLETKGSKGSIERLAFYDASKTLTVRGAVRETTELRPATVDDTAYLNTVGKRTFLHAVPLTLIRVFGEDGGVHNGIGLLDDDIEIQGNIMCLRLMGRRLKPCEAAPFNMHEDLLLILRQEDNRQDMYQRIGIGVISGRQSWFADSPSLSINIR